MKARKSFWLQVCLCSALCMSGVFTIEAASSANGAIGDVPATVRTTEESSRQFSAYSIAKQDVQILERARAANEDVYSSLESFVCNEDISRFKGSLNGLAVQHLDTVTAKLSFERGIEQYTNIREDNQPKTSISTLPGAWSEGEFGTLLLQTQDLLTTKKVDFESYARLDGEQTAIYHFDVTAEESPWDLTVAGRHYRLPFRTSVWVSVDTGEVLRIERATLSISSDIRISEIRWGISMQHFNLNGKIWLLPATGTYAVVYNGSNHREWNQISFTGYQRYGAETALKFQ